MREGTRITRASVRAALKLARKTTQTRVRSFPWLAYPLGSPVWQCAYKCTSHTKLLEEGTYNDEDLDFKSFPMTWEEATALANSHILCEAADYLEPNKRHDRSEFRGKGRLDERLLAYFKGTKVRLVCSHKVIVPKK